MIVSQKLIAWIKKDEGLRGHLYTDTTGHTTIGWGRDLENGISLDEADLMFQNDLRRTIRQLEQFEWFLNQPQHVQDALVNMTFNLGLSKLLTFQKMLSALKINDYTVAAQEALNSEWACQVGERAKEIAAMIRQP